MTHETTARRTPRAANAVRTVRIARELSALAPGVATIRTTPVWTGTSMVPRRATWVTLDDAHGRPVTADRAAHQVARDVLRRHFSRADWTRMHRYDVRTGRLTPLATPFGPAELGAGSEPHQ